MDRKLDVWVSCQTKQKPKNKLVKRGLFVFAFSVTVLQALFGCLQSAGQKKENTSTETWTWTDIWERSERAHTPAQTLEYDEWSLGSGGCTSLGRRTNFVPSSVHCLSFLVSDEPAETLGNNAQCQQGGHNTSVTAPDALCTLSCLYCIVCRPHGSLKVSRSALRWWITYKDWESSRVSCFLICPMFVMGHGGESSVSRPASGRVTDAESLHRWCLTNHPHLGLCWLLTRNVFVVDCVWS